MSDVRAHMSVRTLPHIISTRLRSYGLLSSGGGRRLRIVSARPFAGGGDAQSFAEGPVCDFDSVGAQAPHSVARLAKCGNSGNNPKTLARDVQRCFQAEADLEACVPDMYEFDLELYKKANQPTLGAEFVKFQALLPREYMGHLWRFKREKFNALFLGEDGAYNAFWQHEFDKPWARLNDDLHQWASPDDVMAIPTGLHGDDAKYVKNGKLMILSFNGVLYRGKHSRLVITALDYGRATPRSLDMIYDVIVWSYNVMSTGRWPDRDHTGRLFTNKRSWRYKLRGKSLMGGWIGIWTETRGAPCPHLARHLCTLQADWMVRASDGASWSERLPPPPDPLPPKWLRTRNSSTRLPSPGLPFARALC